MQWFCAHKSLLAAAATCSTCRHAVCWHARSCAHAGEQVLCLLAKAHVDLGDGSTAALNCIARLRHDVPDVGGNRGVLPLLALQACLQLDRYAGDGPTSGSLTCTAKCCSLC